MTEETRSIPHQHRVDRSKMRALLKKHNGSFHGPNVEHLSISEENFWAMMDDYTDILLRREAWDNVARRTSSEYASARFGQRP